MAFVRTHTSPKVVNKLAAEEDEYCTYGRSHEIFTDCHTQNILKHLGLKELLYALVTKPEVSEIIKPEIERRDKPRQYT